MKAETFDATMVKVGSATTYGGAGSTLFGWLTINDIAAIVGMVGVIVGVGLQAYFGVNRNRRERAAHDAENSARAEQKRRDDELHQARLEAIRSGREE